MMIVPQRCTAPRKKKNPSRKRWHQLSGTSDGGGKKKGSLVLVKRLMYYWEYGDCPPMPIKLVCGNKNCVNPAHMRITGYEKEAYQEIENQIERGILYPDDAKEWFGYAPPETPKVGMKAASEQL
jgi:hypothetical protein